MKLSTLRRRVNQARKHEPLVTCSASRHLHILADELLSKAGCPQLQDEPEHCAETMLAVLLALWQARAALQEGESACTKEH